jgi:hypothetical protein
VKESVVEDYLVRRVVANGGEVRKVRWIGRRGAPDRRVMLPGRCFWVELKAPGVPPEAHQAREHKRMRAMGEDVRIIDSIKGVNECLK